MAISAVISTWLVAIAAIATSRLGHWGRRCRSLLEGHHSGLVCQIQPILQPFLGKIKETIKFGFIAVSFLLLEPFP